MASEQVPSDSRLKLLRESAEWDKKHGDAVVLHPDVALALIECADALKLALLVLSGEGMNKLVLIRALEKGRDALANLEAL